MVQYRGKISVLELIVYAPCFPIALWLTIRHGLRRSAGWIYVIIFAEVRAGGAITQLLSESHPTSIPLYTAEAILQSVGLNPLLFIALCHLSRVNRSISITRSRRRPVSRWITHGIGSLVIVASALSIVGGINGAKSLTSPSTSSTTRTFHTTSATKAGILLFVLCYGLLILTTLLTALHFHAAEPGERRLGYSILLTLPFIGVRLLYSLLVVFSNKPRFNLLTGSVTIWLFMAVLEEMAVVGIFLATGWTMRGVEKGRPQVHVLGTGETGPDEPMLVNQPQAPGGYQMVNTV